MHEFTLLRGKIESQEPLLYSPENSSIREYFIGINLGKIDIPEIDIKDYSNKITSLFVVKTTDLEEKSLKDIKDIIGFYVTMTKSKFRIIYSKPSFTERNILKTSFNQTTLSNKHNLLINCITCRLIASKKLLDNSVYLCSLSSIGPYSSDRGISSQYHRHIPVVFKKNSLLPDFSKEYLVVGSIINFPDHCSGPSGRLGIYAEIVEEIR